MANCLCSKYSLRAEIERRRAQSGAVGRPRSGQVGYVSQPECAAMPGYAQAYQATVTGAQAMCLTEGAPGDEAYEQCVAAQQATLYAQNVTPACTQWLASQKTPVTKKDGGGGGTVVTCPDGSIKVPGKECPVPVVVDEGVSPWWFIGGAAVIGLVAGGVYAYSKKGRR